MRLLESHRAENVQLYKELGISSAWIFRGGERIKPVRVIFEKIICNGWESAILACPSCAAAQHNTHLCTLLDKEGPEQKDQDQQRYAVRGRAEGQCQLQ